MTMSVKFYAAFLSALTLADGRLLRRTGNVRPFEFGRMVAEMNESSESLFHEHAAFRMLDGMSVDNSGNMSFDPSGPMSMDLSGPMSMDFGGPMSMDFGGPMSMDVGLPEEPSVCDESNPSINIDARFEVETTSGITGEDHLMTILSNAIENHFSLCSDPDAVRLLMGGRMLQSTVAAIKVVDAAIVDDETCASEAEDAQCSVVDATLQVFLQEDGLDDAARDEVLETLPNRVSETEGTRGSTENKSTGDGTTTTRERLTKPHTAMVAILSLAAVSIVAVFVQRKMSKHKRDDDKSVVSMETIPNTTYDTAPLTT